jgi:hypothetical protein
VGVGVSKTTQVRATLPRGQMNNTKTKKNVKKQHVVGRVQLARRPPPAPATTHPSLIPQDTGRSALINKGHNNGTKSMRFCSSLVSGDDVTEIHNRNAFPRKPFSSSNCPPPLPNHGKGTRQASRCVAVCTAGDDALVWKHGRGVWGPRDKWGMGRGPVLWGRRGVGCPFLCNPP